MLKQLYLKYLKRLLIFTISVLLIEMLIKHYLPEIISPHIAYLILLFLVMTGVAHYIILKTDVKRLEYSYDQNKTKEEQMQNIMAVERKFISRYFLTTTIKLLVYLTVLIIYAFVNREGMLQFSLNFVVLYVLLQYLKSL